MVESIVNDVKTHVEHLKDLDMINTKVERMTGITNETYQVTQKNSNLKPVIYRRFGESNTSNFYLNIQTSFSIETLKKSFINTSLMKDSDQRFTVILESILEFKSLSNPVY